MKGFYTDGKKKKILIIAVLGLLVFDVVSNIFINSYYDNQKAKAGQEIRETLNIKEEEVSPKEAVTWDSIKDSLNDVDVDKATKDTILNGMSSPVQKSNEEGNSIGTDVSGQSYDASETKKEWLSSPSPSVSPLEESPADETVDEPLTEDDTTKETKEE